MRAGFCVLLAAAIGLSAPLAAHAKSSGSHQRVAQPKAIATVKRDLHGRIERSSSARAAFSRSRPCPSTGRSSGACPG
jgi:hypothetical protein